MAYGPTKWSQPSGLTKLRNTFPTSLVEVIINSVLEFYLYTYVKSFIYSVSKILELASN